MPPGPGIVGIVQLQEIAGICVEGSVVAETKAVRVVSSSGFAVEGDHLPRTVDPEFEVEPAIDRVDAEPGPDDVDVPARREGVVHLAELGDRVLADAR